MSTTTRSPPTITTARPSPRSSTTSPTPAAVVRTRLPTRTAAPSARSSCSTAATARAPAEMPSSTSPPRVARRRLVHRRARRPQRLLDQLPRLEQVRPGLFPRPPLGVTLPTAERRVARLHRLEFQCQARGAPFTLGVARGEGRLERLERPGAALRVGQQGVEGARRARHVGFGLREHRRVDAEAARDGQPVRPARHPLLEAVGGPDRLGVELEGGVDDAAPPAPRRA